jgi:hypothetical protein
MSMFCAHLLEVEATSQGCHHMTCRDVLLSQNFMCQFHVQQACNKKSPQAPSEDAGTDKGFHRWPLDMMYAKLPTESRDEAAEALMHMEKL